MYEPTPNEPNADVRQGNLERVTVYYSSEMGGAIRRVEAKLVSYGTRKWAQYDHAPFAVFIPKGKRSKRVLQTGYQPFLVIVRGVGPMLDDGYDVVHQDAQATVSRARHLAFDDAWDLEAGAVLDKVPADRVLFDVRAVKAD